MFVMFETALLELAAWLGDLTGVALTSSANRYAPQNAKKEKIPRMLKSDVSHVEPS